MSQEYLGTHDFSNATVTGVGGSTKAFLSFPFETAASYSTTVTGSGAVSLSGAGMNLATGTTAASSAAITRVVVGGFTLSDLFDIDPEFSTIAVLSNNTSTNFVSSLLVGTNSDPDASGNITAAHFGFILDGTTLYASSANGTTQTKTDVSSGITLTAANRFHAVMNSGTDVKFYINGSLVDTQAATLPSGGASRCFKGFLKNDTGVTTSRFTYSDAISFGYTSLA